MQVEFRGHTLNVEFDFYQENKRKAITLSAQNGERFLVASVNLPDVDIDEDQIAIKDYSENQGVLDCLVGARIISEPLFYLESGFVRIPVCKLLK